MKWEVFTGFERKHKVHEAKINIEQLQNQIDDTKENYNCFWKITM
jgi:hypothetical protein